MNEEVLKEMKSFLNNEDSSEDLWNQWYIVQFYISIVTIIITYLMSTEVPIDELERTSLYDIARVKREERE